MKQAIMQWLLKQLGSFCNWLMGWCKDSIDFPLILAVCTETPRWTVTFMAIHEPLWIGVALGVLLAFATSKVWKHYFATRSWITLLFNVLALILSVVVISPVLFAMTEKEPDQVDIMQVLPDWRWRAGWSTALALTTFVPLVQLAAVHGATVKPTKTEDKPSTTENETPIVADETSGASPQEQPPALEPATQQDDETAQRPAIAHRFASLQDEGLDENQIIAQLKQEDYSLRDIGKLFGKSASTISRRNGATKEAA